MTVKYDDSLTKPIILTKIINKTDFENCLHILTSFTFLESLYFITKYNKVLDDIELTIKTSFRLNNDQNSFIKSTKTIKNEFCFFKFDLTLLNVTTFDTSLIYYLTLVCNKDVPIDLNFNMILYGL
jgi:hypothetical protein